MIPYLPINLNADCSQSGEIVIEHFVLSQLPRPQTEVNIQFSCVLLKLGAEFQRLKYFILVPSGHTQRPSCSKSDPPNQKLDPAGNIYQFNSRLSGKNSIEILQFTGIISPFRNPINDLLVGGIHYGHQAHRLGVLA